MLEFSGPTWSLSCAAKALGDIVSPHSKPIKQDDHCWQLGEDISLVKSGHFRLCWTPHSEIPANLTEIVKGMGFKLVKRSFIKVVFNHDLKRDTATQCLNAALRLANSKEWFFDGFRTAYTTFSPQNKMICEHALKLAAEINKRTFQGISVPQVKATHVLHRNGTIFLE